MKKWGTENAAEYPKFFMKLGGKNQAWTLKWTLIQVYMSGGNVKLRWSPGRGGPAPGLSPVWTQASPLTSWYLHSSALSCSSTPLSRTLGRSCHKVLWAGGATGLPLGASFPVPAPV